MVFELPQGDPFHKAKKGGIHFWSTVKLGFKERLNKEQVSATNMTVHLISSEEIGFSEQLCENQKVPYCQVWLYKCT